jgi:putative sterol carrier protein
MTSPQSPMDPERFAELVREATDDQLAEGMAVNREVILEQIFNRMPESLDADRARDLDAVIEWQITGRPNGGVDRFQVVISNGECHVEREGSAEPRVTYTLGPVDFVRLVTGNVPGPKLFVFGKLKIRGDILLAARMPSLFNTPRPRGRMPPDTEG